MDGTQCAKLILSTAEIVFLKSINGEKILHCQSILSIRLLLFAMKPKFFSSSSDLDDSCMYATANATEEYNQQSVNAVVDHAYLQESDSDLHNCVATTISERRDPREHAPTHSKEKCLLVLTQIKSGRDLYASLSTHSTHHSIPSQSRRDVSMSIN